VEWRQKIPELLSGRDRVNARCKFRQIVGARPHRAAQNASQSVGWAGWIPCVTALHEYDPSWLKHDVVAGLVMTTMLVPVGIADAEESGSACLRRVWAEQNPLSLGRIQHPRRYSGCGDTARF
jgi:hypothetical protein